MNPDPQLDELVASVEKNAREELRISVKTFHGRTIINFRVFYVDAAGEWLPGKQGLAIGVDRYRELAAAMVTLGEKLQADGLLSSG